MMKADRKHVGGRGCCININKWFQCGIGNVADLFEGYNLHLPMGLVSYNNHPHNTSQRNAHY